MDEVNLKYVENIKFTLMLQPISNIPSSRQGRGHNLFNFLFNSRHFKIPELISADKMLTFFWYKCI